MLAAIVLYDAAAGRLPDLSESQDTAFVALVLMPALMSVLWLTLPIARGGMVVIAGVGLTAAALALLLDAIGADSAFNAAKLLTFTLAGFAFLELFQELSWVVLVAALIPWIDSFSVWRGPTREVMTKHPGLFDRISIAFRLPGESGSAKVTEGRRASRST